jgi:hypothetical protein
MFLRPSFDLQINTINKFFRRIKTKPNFTCCYSENFHCYSMLIQRKFYMLLQHAETVKFLHVDTVKFYMLIQ